MASASYRGQTLEMIALNIIKSFDASLLEDPQRAIPVEEIIEFKYFVNIEYHYLRKTFRVLGITVYDDGFVPVYDMDEKKYTTVWVKGGTIMIDARLLQPKYAGRLRFTYAHELAHWVLHKEEFAGSNESAAMLNIASKHDSERQADLLGTALLMPAGRVKIAFYKTRGKCSVDQTITELANIFNVSRQAMEIRMKSCNLIE